MLLHLNFANTLTVPMHYELILINVQLFIVLSVVFKVILLKKNLSKHYTILNQNLTSHISSLFKTCFKIAKTLQYFFCLIF